MLRCNLDETCVCLNHLKQRGIISSLPATDVVLSAEMAPKRGSLTHVAIICDNTTVQPMLPQFILGNHKILQAGDLTNLAGRVPENVYVVRGKSSWVNNTVMCMILQTLRSCLQAKGIHQEVLFHCGTHVRRIATTWCGELRASPGYACALCLPA